MRYVIPREKQKDYHYSEGSYVFYRDGKYYFMWSENDTRSPEYRVRYAISDSPVRLDNPISETIVLRKDPDQANLRTGHHAVINKPGPTSGI